jgi:hypothetical protein
VLNGRGLPRICCGTCVMAVPPMELERLPHGYSPRAHAACHSQVCLLLCCARSEYEGCMRVCMCVCVCARACMCACVRACVVLQIKHSTFLVPVVSKSTSTSSALLSGLCRAATSPRKCHSLSAMASASSSLTRSCGQRQRHPRVDNRQQTHNVPWLLLPAPSRASVVEGRTHTCVK